MERHIDVAGFPVCDIDDVIRSKEAANRQKDRESLPRLLQFREIGCGNASLLEQFRARLRICARQTVAIPKASSDQ